MKTKGLIIAILIIVSYQSCKKNTSKSNSYNSERTYFEDDDKTYEDDTYCADVEYYNPDTGFSNDYTLNVDVEYNEVVKIHFSSGWLDDSEFSSEELDADGYCEIILFDGREFTIQITGSECSFNDGYYIENDVAESKCLRCGYSKDEYEDYCEDCKNYLENTCSRCGAFEYYVYQGLCSDCKEDEYDNDDW